MTTWDSHTRVFEDNLWVYPVVSRRARGLSLGINLSQEQQCNFACVYCQVDRREGRAAPPQQLDRLENELSEALRLVRSGELWNLPRFQGTPEERRRLNDIAFSGDGEPTAETLFPEAVERVRRLRAREGANEAKIVVITNGTRLKDKTIRGILAQIVRDRGEVWAKLDAGTESFYRKVNGGQMPLSEILEGLKALAAEVPIVIQSLFFKWDGTSPPKKEIDAYIANLCAVAAAGTIDRVQLYTVSRRPKLSAVTSLGAEELEAIAARIRQEAGLSVDAILPPKNLGS